MDNRLKEEILGNQFVDKLRLELTVDEEEYAKLLASLKLLSQEWQGEESVDKELMADLYVLAPFCRNMTSWMTDRSEQIEEMATEIDAHVLDCLAITYTEDDIPRLAKRLGVAED